MRLIKYTTVNVKVRISRESSWKIFTKNFCTGTILTREKDFNGAIDLYKNALKANPDQWILNLNIGRLARQVGDDDQALRYYTLALESNQANNQQKKEIFTARAAIKYKRGNLKGALVEYEKALEFAPKDPKISYSIKRLRVELGG